MLREAILVIEVSYPNGIFVYAREFSPFVYVLGMWDKHCHTLNTNTMEFLPALQIEGADPIRSIHSVFFGEITVEAKTEDSFYTISAQLPAGYISCEIRPYITAR
ncbi:hypothetical protein PMAYCL1PPCAC_09623 [Pristionchus mayeri]|uniref:Uncharacterized protein n=1 Tax=Pristionchus mayeri TaxID=1317129 RepID=A0AAN4ZDW8_9BILA|nr:hypothetical protein PMAYCL1PPCAC_09623 [Pristionchus mayeri]